MKFKNIYIIGNGVMGKLLHQRINKFYAANVITFDKGDVLSFTDGTESDPNLIIVATPISQIPVTLEKISELGPKWSYIVEIGSVKGRFSDYADIIVKANRDKLYFDSVHPMVGPLAKDWDVLEWKKKCIFVNFNSGTLFSNPIVVNFWERLGFETRYLDPDRHDEIIGKLSHLSHFMIMSYVRYVNETLEPEELELAGPSFETFSKLAEGAERLHDIYEANEQLPDLVDGLYRQMQWDLGFE